MRALSKGHYEKDPHPLRTLVIFVIAMIAIFVAGLFLVLAILADYAGVSYDPSVLKFYPVMAILGAVVGFELWWSYEYGPVNRSEFYGRLDHVESLFPLHLQALSPKGL